MRVLCIALITLLGCGKHHDSPVPPQSQEENTTTLYSVILEPVSSRVHGVSTIGAEGSIKIAVSGLDPSKGYRQMIASADCRSSVLMELDPSSSDQLGLYSFATTAAFNELDLRDRSLVIEDATSGRLVACGKIERRNWPID